MFDNFFQQKKLLRIIAFAFPVLLYLNTIPNDYALDDSIVITENNFVKEGISGIKNIFTHDSFIGFFKKKRDLVEGGRYRPLSIASYAVEYSIWKSDPHLSHLINAMLYGLLSLVVFIFLKKILRYLGYESIAIPVAFISTLLFASHPIHTEVVANIKGRDEMLAFLFGFLSLNQFIVYLEKSKIQYAAASGVLLFLGLLSKENAITIVAVAALIIVINFKKEFFSRYINAMIFLSLGTALYLVIHSQVVGGFSKTVADELMNNPYLYASKYEKFPTIFYTLLIYIKLLFSPHPLTFDYYPYHIQLQTWQNPLVLLSIVIHVMIIIGAFYYLNRNKIISFAIFFYFLTLLPVSNIFINIGSFMNERFVFFSSLGFCLVCGYLIFGIYQRFSNSTLKQNLIVSGYVIILIFFSIILLQRNTNWKDNYTLFLHDVKISSGSAKSNCAAGGVLLEKSQNETDTVQKRIELNNSINYLKSAVRIYPNYVDALLLLGNAYYFHDTDMKNAMTIYNKIFDQAPGYDLAFQNFKKILISAKNPDDKKTGYKEILKYNSSDFEANYQLGILYGKVFNNLDSATIFLSKAVKLNPKSIEANRDCGVAFAIKGTPAMAVPYFKQAILLEPNEPSNYINLGLACQKLGDIPKANELFRKAEELKNKAETKKN